jgi:hypothetical protein
MDISGDFANGIKFYGSKGWIFVSRGNEQVTKRAIRCAKLNDCDCTGRQRHLQFIKSVIGPDEIHLYESKEQHGNWLDSASVSASSRYRRSRWGIAPARPA